MHKVGSLLKCSLSKKRSKRFQLMGKRSYKRCKYRERRASLSLDFAGGQGGEDRGAMMERLGASRG
jgi:hypothetical protein